jgi:hypothetical protein
MGASAAEHSHVEEESKDSDIAGTFAVLSSNLLTQAYMHELKTAFLKARAQEAELKAPKAAADGE